MYFPYFLFSLFSAIFCYLLYSSRYRHNLLQDAGLCGSVGSISRDAPECQLGPTAPQFVMGPRFHTWHWKNFHQNYCELDVALRTQVFKNENHFLLILTETVCENHKPSWNTGCFINVSNGSTNHIHNKVFSDVPVWVQRDRTHYTGTSAHIFPKRPSNAHCRDAKTVLIYLFCLH